MSLCLSFVSNLAHKSLPLFAKTGANLSFHNKFPSIQAVIVGVVIIFFYSALDSWFILHSSARNRSGNVDSPWETLPLLLLLLLIREKLLLLLLWFSRRKKNGEKYPNHYSREGQVFSVGTARNVSSIKAGEAEKNSSGTKPTDYEDKRNLDERYSFIDSLGG